MMALPVMLLHPGTKSCSLPGDFGFDPLGLGSDPELLKWFAQAELMHNRWAMLVVAGILIPECMERLEFLDSFSWYDAGSQRYFTNPVTLFIVQMVLMGWEEGRRYADMIKPSSMDIEPKSHNMKNLTPDVGYPGGLWFDLIMWLAMLAFVGFVFQAFYMGTGPIENLMAHS